MKDRTALFGNRHLKPRLSGFDMFAVFHDQGEYWDSLFKTAEGWIDDTERAGGKREKGFSTDLVTLHNPCYDAVSAPSFG